jgi:hypothetical protein
MRLIPAALLAVALLAGCSGPGSLTAREALDAALKEAHGWDTSARLLSVSGAEMANAQGYLEALRTLGADDKDLTADGTQQLLPRDDGHLGDGRLPAWGFIFGHDKPGTLRVVVGGGKVTFTKESPGGSSAGVPNLANDTRWKVDSDRLTDALRGNATLEKIRASSSGVLTYSLGATSRNLNLRWSVTGGDRGILNQTFSARISATNGTLAPLRAPTLTLPPPPKLPAIEAGSAKGTATLGSTTKASFTLGEHGSVAFLLRIPGNTVPGSLRATVTSPDGQSATMQASAFIPGSGGEDHATVERVASGGWSASFSVPTGVSEDYELFWCTDGSGDAPDNPAC